MSMSQEEIEALMNGADFEPEEESQSSESEESSAEESPVEDNIDDILAGIDGVTEDDSETEDNFDDILAGIDGISEDDAPSTDDNIDDILAGIDGVTEDAPVQAETSKGDNTNNTLEEQIEEGRYPLPVENEHKVVNQLNQVAEDSEEKASQIFDVLSFILDENSEVEKYNKNMNSFIEKQIELLDSLGNKFPNITLFKENLELAKDSLESSNELSSRVNNENNKVFEAMELMQYHDINRQKIERVMSVIRKLSTYLNGIFEDESDKPEVQIAKHISGDANDTLADDDLESLISEFGNEG